MNNMPEIWFPHLGIEIPHLSNIAISIGNFDVYWYGVIIGCAIIIGILLATYEAKRSGQNSDTYFDFIFIAIITCVIGARLYYVLFSFDYYSQHPKEIFNLRNGGLAIYGAVIMGILTAIIFTKKKKLNLGLFLDTCAPSLILGQAIGRFGNFFNREAFGGYTDSLFAMRLMESQVRKSDLTPDIINNIVNINGTSYIQVHPTFLYESVWNLCIFALLMYTLRHKKFNGQVFSMYAIGYGIGRFFIEGLRTDQLTIANTGIAISQVVSICMIAAGIIIYILFLKNKKNSHISD